LRLTLRLYPAASPGSDLTGDNKDNRVEKVNLSACHVEALAKTGLRCLLANSERFREQALSEFPSVKSPRSRRTTPIVHGEIQGDGQVASELTIETSLEVFEKVIEFRNQGVPSVMTFDSLSS